ncbi:TIGR01459 family HAD-type hydrolase [Marinimicrococcus flavescens]|uniref:TIGR01459 family HAD-type hydrolase n=1 Tax=Marinimicrococcus flavescens TaxID=3031815 RepID=A0AAP4D6D8_9PROT|nr:TIGR01459 family HAD-type hydrolase [Marinimicrococcus flavescens]
MTAPRLAGGIGVLADRYDAFILDQWGVLHNGSQPYPGAVEAVHRLKEAGKRVALLSNSGRRAAHNRAMLAHLGFEPADFDGIVTSGEAAWRVLSRGLPPFDGLGRRCYLITRGGDRAVVEGLGVELVEDPHEADFLFASGVDSPEMGLEDYKAALDVAARRGLPLLCSNPDHWAPSSDGLVLAPGALAAYHAVQDGQVLYVGKPHRPIYDACFEILDGVARERIVAVGDSFEHDVKGANNAGIDACFVAGGLHAAELDGLEGEACEQAVAELARRHEARAAWVVPAFRW